MFHNFNLSVRLCFRQISTFHRPRRPLGRVEVFLTSALEGGEGSASRPGRTLSQGKTRQPLYRRLFGPQGPSGQMRKIPPPPGFELWTFQPVGSRYTDYGTRPTAFVLKRLKTQYDPHPARIRCQNFFSSSAGNRISFRLECFKLYDSTVKQIKN